MTIFLLWYVLKDNFEQSLSVLSSANVFWLILCFLAYVIYFLLETLVLRDIINQSKKDYKFKSAFKLYLMTKFFNGITPFSSGGQPLQIYELKKEGVRVTDGTTIIIKHFIIFQTAIDILALVGLIFNTIFDVIHCEPFLNYLLVIGFVINFGLLSLVYFLSYNIKISQKIITAIINFLAKLKLVKDQDKKIEQFCNSCTDYSDSYHTLISNKKKFFKLLGIEILALLFMFILPIFVFKSLGYTVTLNIFVFLVIAIYVFFVGSYVPIPGGTGGMEYAFIGFFSYYISNKYLTTAVILWRTIDYYLPVIIGGIFFNLERSKQNK